MQALLNNARSTTTTKSLNEISYGFKPNKPLDLLTTDLSQQNHIKARVKTIDAISFAQMHQKFHYNRKHQPIYFKKENKVLLRLHKGYFIPQPADTTKADKLG